MIRVRFIGVDGSVREAWGVEGARLLDVAQADGQPLEGTCDGDMACATCHVIVAAEDADRLPPPRRRRKTCSTWCRRRRGPAGWRVRSGWVQRSTG